MQTNAVLSMCAGCNFLFFRVPTWGAVPATFSGAPSEAQEVIKGHCCQDKRSQIICRLLHPSWRYSTIFVGILSHFFMFFHYFRYFFGGMISTGDPVSP